MSIDIRKKLYDVFDIVSAGYVHTYEKAVQYEDDPWATAIHKADAARIDEYLRSDAGQKRIYFVREDGHSSIPFCHALFIIGKELAEKDIRSKVHTCPGCANCTPVCPPEVYDLTRE